MNTSKLWSGLWMIRTGIVIGLILGPMGCSGGDSDSTTCSDSLDEIGSVCPSGTQPTLKQNTSGTCSTDSSNLFTADSGEIVGTCRSAGECEFVCVVEDSKCECGVKDITDSEVVCQSCSICGDGLCSPTETAETCAQDCATSCTAGRLRCVGDQREECSFNGEWNRLPCPVGEQCQEVGGDVSCGRICAVGQTRCTDGQREQCTLEGTWEPNACDEGEQCIAQSDNTGSCVVPCEVGVSRCRGADREECGEDGQWTIVECPANEQCVVDNDTVTCRAACEPGLVRCDGIVRQQCSDDGEWVTIPCPGNEQCFVDGANAVCRPVCEPSASRCVGNSREVCSDGGEWQNLPCPDGFRCTDEPNVACTLIDTCGEAGVTRCVNNALETCTAGGAWESQVCEGESRCNAMFGNAMCVDCMDRWWADLDGDGFGDPATEIRACEQPEGFVASGGEADCRDDDPDIFPGKRESCDRIDNDCDMNLDEGAQPLCGIGEFCENRAECKTNECNNQYNVCVGPGLSIVGAGVNVQGSAVSGRASESPAHDVRISRSFFIQTTEVTNAQWDSVYPDNPSLTPGDDRPVQNVSFYDALAYANALSQREDVSKCYDLSGCEGTPGLNFTCANMDGGPRFIVDCLGYRLPTEAEWEHASRNRQVGGWFARRWEDDEPIPGAAFLNAALDPLGWFSGNSFDELFEGRRPQAVGQKNATFSGLFDMHGNVSEWTWDVYDEAAYTGRLTLCEDAADCPAGDCGENGVCTAPIVDPIQHFAPIGMVESRVIRGGSYESSAFDCRHASRRRSPGKAPNIGFRLVRGLLQ